MQERTLAQRLTLHVVVLAALLLFGFVLRETVIRNITPSEPLGWYLVLPATQLHYGDLAWLCEPPDAHSFAVAHHFIDARRDWPLHGCPESRLILKNVWGLPGDHFSVSAAGVVRNGELLGNSKPVALASDGTAMPFASPTTVPGGSIWGGSIVERSYDSRYFGPARLIARAIRIPGWVVYGVILTSVALAVWLLIGPRSAGAPVGYSDFEG